MSPFSLDVAHATASAIDTVEFFAALADEMNAHPERFLVLGDAEMDAVLVMQAADRAFCIKLRFDGVRCDEVVEVPPDEIHLADFCLEGPLQAWRAMFADIVDHGRATGMQTINALTLLGDEIKLVGSDPMGIDKFSRFNQTLQEFFDGAVIALATTAKR
jgi:hypothetical protein